MQYNNFFNKFEYKSDVKEKNENFFKNKSEIYYVY
jgi:hypothetical protein